MTQVPALCAEIDPELFFPASSNGDMQTAKWVCSRCDIREKCLETALTFEKGSPRSWRHGIWGGLSPTQRAKLAKASS